jgi:hypothetical protein
MRSYVFFIILALIIAACAPSPEKQAAMTATSMTATAAAWTPTSSPTKSPTNTTTPTPTYTSTPTRIPTRTLLPTYTPSVTPTLDPNRFYASDGRFSMLFPTGWTAKEAGMQYPGLFANTDEKNSPNIIFYTDTSPFPVEFYAAGVQDSLGKNETSITTVSEDFPTTSGGYNYFRWEFKYREGGLPIHTVMYFFENGEWKLILSYSRLADQGTENDQLVETAVDSIQFSP